MKTRSVATLLVAAAVCAACSTDPQKAKVAYMRSGDAYAAKQQYREAIIQYRTAIQKDPKFGEARRKLADMYERVGDAVNAYREWVRAADLLPDNLDVQTKAGAYLLLSGQFEDAKTRAQKVLETHPKSVDAQILLGNALAGLKDLDQAVAEIEQAIQIDPEHGRAYANLGILQLARGQRAEAEKALKKALELDPKAISAHLALANYYWAVGRRDETENTLKGALALQPNDQLANRAMAVFYLASGRGAEAEPYLKVSAAEADAFEPRLTLADYYIYSARTDDAAKTLETIPDTNPVMYANAQVRLAAIEYAGKKQPDAYARLEKILAKQPQNVRALVVKARFQLAEEKFDDALTTAGAALASDERSVEAHYVKGMALAAKNDTSKAIAEFNEVVKINPRAGAAQAQLARLYLAQGQTATSVQFARDAVKSQPANPDSQVILVRALRAQGDVAKAETELKPLLDKFGKSAVVQAEAGAVALAKRDTTSARAAFDRALAIDPESVDGLTGLVALDVAARNGAAARARVDAALLKDPKNPALLLLAARTHGTTGSAARSVELDRQTIENDPGNLEAYLQLGRLYMMQGKLDRARVEYETLASRETRPVAASTMVGIILQSQNKVAEAKKWYRQALDIDPHSPVAANNLAWAMIENGENADIALQLAQTAKARWPNRPEISDTLGWIYYQKNMLPQAIAALVQSVNREPKNPVFHYHLGMVYARSGDKAKARVALEQALKLRSDFEGAAEARKTLTDLEG